MTALRRSNASLRPLIRLRSRSLADILLTFLRSELVTLRCLLFRFTFFVESGSASDVAKEFASFALFALFVSFALGFDADSAVSSDGGLIVS